VAGPPAAFDPLRRFSDVCFIVLGAAPGDALPPNVRCFPVPAPVFHPDLVRAADVVIGKVGYSTLAEVYHAGVPFGYIPRNGYCESEKLVDFIETQMTGLPIAEPDFQSGRWVSQLGRLLAARRCVPGRRNGAETVADDLVARLSQAAPTGW
jgi:hypothetical protein